MADEHIVRFEFKCIKLPGLAFGDKTRIRLGIQEGKSVIDHMPGDKDEVTFKFSLRVKRNPGTG
jgi:hypothetical protein